MPIPETLTTDPYTILDPDDRWRPGTEDELPLGQLMPPLVEDVRRTVKEWRDTGYPNISDTSRALLSWWFNRDEESPGVRYYFSQREAVESVIYLYEAAKIKDKVDLLRFDSTGQVNQQMMPENWQRFVIKMATGSGKTKVVSLLIAWSYFHKLYEADSKLSRNILLIAPNIIVLDRLYRDFENLHIFYEDTILPPNGYAGQNWGDDFQMQIHKQDEVRTNSKTGNIFLTNIHRVYVRDDKLPSADDDDTRDYFLDPKAKDPIANKIDLGEIVRELDELLIINDEAHHIHDEKMAWFKTIEDMHNTLVQKGLSLSLQIDVTATPKHTNGSIFVQTIADYPLVEAIHQNVVKRPVIPDEESVNALKEQQSTEYGERFHDYIQLGVDEWRKAYAENKKVKKKSVLFLMTDDTHNCDDLGKYLEEKYADLKDSVLVIHTKQNGEISEATKNSKKEAELSKLRKHAESIDDWDNPYKAVVSVLVLREGWDVRNVTTIVGLRAYTAKANILPEQTLGRGLRLMFPDQNDIGEKVSVIGSPAFADFVREIEKEGVRLERAAMGEGSRPNTSVFISIDHENENKNIPELEIKVPILSARVYKDFSKLEQLKAEDIACTAQEYKTFPPDAPRKIIFIDAITGKESHTTTLSENIVDDYSRVVGYFAREVGHQNKLFSHYAFLYEVVQDFVRDHLFGKTIDLASEDTIRNLAEPVVSAEIMESLRNAIQKLLIERKPQVEVQSELKVTDMRHSPMKSPKYSYAPVKSPQNLIAENYSLEYEFAQFLDKCPDVASFAKNYLAVNFNLSYVKTDGTPARYFPDFLVRDDEGKVWIIETKGRVDENDSRKYACLKEWCEYVREFAPEYSVGSLFVKQEKYKQHRPRNFSDLVKIFQDKE